MSLIRLSAQTLSSFMLSTKYFASAKLVDVTKNSHIDDNRSDKTGTENINRFKP